MRSQTAPKLVFGSFDAEATWADTDVTPLPRVPSADVCSVGLSTDELLFPLCQDRDILCTSRPRAEAFVAFLQSVGFRGQNQSCGASYDNGATEELLLHPKNREWLLRALHDGFVLMPYAITECVHRICQSLGVGHQPLPNLATVRRVNSKVWSNSLRDTLACSVNGAVVVYSSEQLRRAGHKLLSDGPFLIKEEFGVSGRGTSLVSSAARLSRLADWFRDHERSRNRTCLLLEPYLNKAFDFSAHLTICRDRQFVIISVQCLQNKGFRYQASHSLDAYTYERLAKTGYFDTLAAIAQCVAEEGYYGPLCVDSMWLADGKIIPLVEINARISMGLISHHLDNHLQQIGKRSYLTVMDVVSTVPYSAEQLLAHMAAQNVLFRPDSNGGVIPLSSHCLPLSDSGKKNPQKGRFFVSIPYYDIASIDAEIARVRAALASFGFVIH